MTLPAPSVREALERSAEGWSNVIELGLLPPQHVKSASVLRDEALTALATPTPADARERIAQTLLDRFIARCNARGGSPFRGGTKINELVASYRDDFMADANAILAAIMPDEAAEDDELKHFPKGLHPNTAKMVRKFTVALAKKLRLAEEKYGYGDGWASDDWESACQRKLIEHLAKGDPRDVAAYCAFMWHHGWMTVAPDEASIRSDEREKCAKVAEGYEPQHELNTAIGRQIGKNIANKIMGGGDA